MRAEGTPGGFGGKLREARERRGISLRQIANATKISVAALEALERNDISRLPGGIFSRAFVRSYAVEVGLEPEATIQEFMAQFPSDTVTAGHPTSRHIDDSDRFEGDRRMASAFLKLLAVAVPVVALVVYIGFVGWRTRVAEAPLSRAVAPAAATTGASATTGAAAPVETATELSPTPGSATTTTPATTGAAPAPPASQFKVGIAASGRSFVSATVDGLHTIDREMQAGEREELAVRREVVLTAGDAGAVALTIDGADAKPLGKSGEPITLRLNTDNVKDYLATR